MSDKVTGALTVFGAEERALMKYQITETSLSMPDGAKFESVERLFGGLKMVGDSTKFWRGDLLIYAQRNYGEQFSQLLDETEYEFQTLKDEMWVAKSIAPSVRRPELTWSHHREVAKLPITDQRRWLDEAVRNKLSVLQLRALIKGPVPEKESKLQAYESLVVSVYEMVVASGMVVPEGKEPEDKGSKLVTAVADMIESVLRAFDVKIRKAKKK